MTELLVGAASVDGGHGLNEVLSRAHPHLDAALTSLTVVAERSQRLSPNGLVPQLADAVGQVQKLLEPIQPLLSRSQAFLDLERYFFSTDHRFLLLWQRLADLLELWFPVALYPEAVHITVVAVDKHPRPHQPVTQCAAQGTKK